MKSPHDVYYDAHSAVELTAYMLPPKSVGLGNDPIAFGTLALISVSTHRDKFPVSACSRIGLRGFTAGHRTVAGTLAFNTIDRAAFSTLVKRAEVSWYADGVLADELPPFDISIIFINEFGEASYTLLEGVTLLDCGITYSLENVTLMENYSYMAKNLVPLQPLKDAKRLASPPDASGRRGYGVLDSTIGTSDFGEMSSPSYIVIPPVF